MSYRDLQVSPAGHPHQLFTNACTYANDLWMRRLPARAILALCRAIYIDPAGLKPVPEQPYKAYVWFLQNHTSGHFIGNPRISFARQATRIPPVYRLKIARAWALWQLTRHAMRDLPADPDFDEEPPSPARLAETLEESGLKGEATAFHEALEAAKSPQD